MKREIVILTLMVKREIFPASDNYDKGLKRGLRLLLFNAPMIGLGLLLLLVTICGLLLLGFQQRVTQKLGEFEANPSNGLFAKARSSFVKLKPNEDENQSIRYNLCDWENLTVDKVFDDTLPTTLRGKRLFSGVKPFSEIQLTFQTQNDETLPYRDVMGLLTPNDPMLNYYDKKEQEMMIDSQLLEKVSKPLLNGSFDGIIVSKEGMKLLDWWSEKDYPKTLQVKKDNNPQSQFISMPLEVVEQLPYVHYMLSMKQLRRIEKGEYNKEMTSITILFNEGPTPQQCESIKNALKALEIKSEGMYGNNMPGMKDKWMFRVTLSTAMPLSTVSNTLSDQTPLFSEIISNEIDSTNGINDYKGAIFHLNFALPAHLLWQTGRITQVRQYFEKKQVYVASGFFELYDETLKLGNTLKNIQRFFWLAVGLIGLILPLIFWVVIQTRMFRIGVKRMVGYSDSMIMTAYAIVGLLLVTCAFAVPTMLCAVALSLPWPEVVLLGMGMLLLTEAGILIPVGYYLYALQPAEMFSFQF